MLHPWNGKGVAQRPWHRVSWCREGGTGGDAGVLAQGIPGFMGYPWWGGERDGSSWKGESGTRREERQQGPIEDAAQKRLMKGLITSQL